MADDTNKPNSIKNSKNNLANEGSEKEVYQATGLGKNPYKFNKGSETGSEIESPDEKDEQKTSNEDFDGIPETETVTDSELLKEFGVQGSENNSLIEKKTKEEVINAEDGTGKENLKKQNFFIVRWFLNVINWIGNKIGSLSTSHEANQVTVNSVIENREQSNQLKKSKLGSTILLNSNSNSKEELNESDRLGSKSNLSSSKLKRYNELEDKYRPPPDGKTAFRSKISIIKYNLDNESSVDRESNSLLDELDHVFDNKKNDDKSYQTKVEKRRSEKSPDAERRRGGK